MFWRHHPIYDPIGVAGHLNDLRAEYISLSWRQRGKLLKRVFERELLLLVSGQKCLQAKLFPANVKRVLWFYDWTTLGDSIMDLSQRFAFPENIALDLCVPKGPAELFDGDRRFHRVYRSVETCPKDYDFILLHDISTSSIKFKVKNYYSTPFASMLGHQQGERFARIDFSAFRLERLLGISISSPYAPRLGERPLAGLMPEPGRIAVALGGKDVRRRYSHWPELLAAVAQAWKPAWPPLRFALIGSGPSAKEDLASFPEEFLAACCEIFLDLPSLLEVQQQIGRSEWFLGADGGLMHIAAALDKPGVCLFSEIRPEWRLLPACRLQSVYTPAAMDNISVATIVGKFIAQADLDYAGRAPSKLACPSGKAFFV